LGDRLLSREVDPRREIQELVDFDGRWPGTDAERRAAVHLKEKLQRLGRHAEVEPIYVRPGWPLAYAILAALAIAGSVISVKSAIAGFAILAVVTLGALGDLTGTFQAIRALTPRRASQNVISKEDGGKPGTLVLMAHYDAARTGALFSNRAIERSAKLNRRLPRSIGPFEPFFWSLVLILVCTLLRLVGFDNLPLTIVQFIPTVLLIVAVPLLADIALSGIVPGANDNASGVATVLRLAERYGGGALQNFNLWVLFPGAEEGLLLGSREWIKRHRKELDPATTVFLNVDTVGYGTVRHVTKEGFVFPLAYHPKLVALCEEIGDSPGLTLRTVTDGYSMRSAGFPAISIACLNELDYVPHSHQHTDTPEHIQPEALENAFAFCCELVDAIDQRALAEG
jgi:hypothetical protein